MTVIPNQFFGLGDIIFTQTLVRRIANGNPVIWGVLPQFVEGLNRAYPDITFVDMATLPINYESKEQYETNMPNIGECTVLPIRWTTEIMKVPYSQCMRSKYDYYGLNYMDWREHAMPDMSRLKFPESLVPKGNFKLINRYFRSNNSGIANIPESGLEMKPIDGVSLFDWIPVMMAATEIHTVSTSIFFLLELLDIKCPIHLYVRKPDEVDFRNIEYLMTKNYILHG